MEMIDSAINHSMGKIYFLKDNHVEIHTDPNCIQKIPKTFETDLVYVSQTLREVLFVEETTDPTKKLKQMNCYQHVSSQSLKMITGADVYPHLDIMIVFPCRYRQEALANYDALDKQSNLGKKIGISLWCYNTNKGSLKCIGGSFSEQFPCKSQEIPITGIGMLKILKNPHPLYLLKFIIMRALEHHYGEMTDEGIEFNKEKLTFWLKPYGIVKEELWRAALQIGSDVEWIEQYSPDQLTGIIKFTKPSAKSISRSKYLMYDFEKATADEYGMDKKQKTLFEYCEDNNNLEDDN